MEVNQIIDFLHAGYVKGLQDGSVSELPDTSGDKKVEAIKEGQIGNILASLIMERFRRFEDTLMIYNGKRYEMMQPEAMKRVITGFMLRLGVGPAYLVRSVEGIFKMILRYPFLEKYEPRRNVVYCKNCVVVLGSDGTVEQYKSGPQWMSNIYLDIEFCDFATCRQWEKFLATVIEDPNAVKVLQEFLGAMFIDKSELSVETALFLYGIGSNGKSVICETLGRLLGDNMSSVGLSQLNGGTGDYYAAKVQGKLLAYNSDENAKDIGSGRFKQLISKEKLMARTPYGTPFETDDWPMFMANINKAIITSDSSEGFWRRNKVIKFSKRFVDNPNEALGELKADKTFKTKMLGELPGILNWIMAGRTRLLKNKGVFTKSRDIERVTEEMKTESTAVFSFLESMRLTGRKREGGVYTEVKYKGRELYEEYRRWCSDNGYSDGKNINRFKNDMEFAGCVFKKSIKFDGGSVTSGYILYSVKYEEGDEIWNDADDLPEADEGTKILEQHRGLFNDPMVSGAQGEDDLPF